LHAPSRNVLLRRGISVPLDETILN
jgi:hypothetical protein